MSEHPVKCQVCSQPGVADCAADYPGARLAAILSMYTCNRCLDLRDRRYRVLGYLDEACHRLGNERLDDVARGKIHKGIEVSLRKLAEIIADQHHSLNRITASEVANAANLLADHPSQAADTLTHFRRLCHLRSEQQARLPAMV